jgi:hypothetical protein
VDSLFATGLLLEEGAELVNPLAVGATVATGWGEVDFEYLARLRQQWIEHFRAHRYRDDISSEAHREAIGPPVVIVALIDPA